MDTEPSQLKYGPLFRWLFDGSTFPRVEYITKPIAAGIAAGMDGDTSQL